MSVNDIVTSGAKPLFFLDYFATSHLDVDLAEKVYQFPLVSEDCRHIFFYKKSINLLFLMQVIKGIVDGCQQSEGERYL